MVNVIVMETNAENESILVAFKIVLKAPVSMTIISTNSITILKPLGHCIFSRIVLSTTAFLGRKKHDPFQLLNDYDFLFIVCTGLMLSCIY